MKAPHKRIAAAILTIVGVIGIQGLAHAGDDDDFGRWGHGGRWQEQRALAESQRLASQIDDRQDNQFDRIMQGFRSGRLTQNEFFNLMQEQRSIHKQERQYLADGWLTPREFDALNQSLDQAGAHIRYEKHDRDAAYNPPPRPYGGPAPWSR